ncbi:MAG: hypothetical protein OEZ39_09120 [Gammaproteobacteria bacterium]|nr:hypothetical protein [Gammaproteobacteria bacterium]MDH5652004.1 hypothetical protein [Gammaproteobacteria bacterium]
MNIRAVSSCVLGLLLAGQTMIALADDNESPNKAEKTTGVQNAIDQNTRNTGKFNEKHPGKATPKGLVRSREVLERKQAGERPGRPEVSRPERPEKPARPEKPEHPNMAKR